MNRMHGIIFAYEQRGELRELTERRTAASMPFGGRYRAVDFALSTLLNVLYFLYTTLLLWVPEAETEHTRRLRWASVPGLVFVALNIAVGLRSYGLMDLFRQGMDLFCQ
mgnify:CR=1 FL=1